MRLPLLLAASLALAACSSDPTDQNPPPPQDVQATDIGVDATDTGVDRLVVDVSDDRPSPIDNGTPDAGVDAGAADVLPDGCVSTTTGNCCGEACPTPVNATAAACVAGRCGVASCNAGFGDCDGNPTNGCETDTRSTTPHCGACGAACASGRGCVGSACVACDADGDGATIPACGGMDCNDANAAIHPGAAEICDGLDDNCDGTGDTPQSLSAYCQRLEASAFPGTNWVGRAECAMATPPTGAGWERFSQASMACRRCRPLGGDPRFRCACSFTADDSFACP